MATYSFSLGPTDTYRERHAAWVDVPGSWSLGVLTIATVGRTRHTTSYHVGWVDDGVLLFEKVPAEDPEGVPEAIASGRRAEELARPSHRLVVQPFGPPVCHCEGGAMAGRCKHSAAVSELLKRGII